MNKMLWFWLAWFFLLLLLDVMVPFYLLGDIPHAGGSLLFWIGWTLLAIGSMFVIFLRWRDNPGKQQG